MPAITKDQAVEKLVVGVGKATPSALAEIYAELFPEKPANPAPSANDLIQHMRAGLAMEEIVDLWNVVFPEDRNVWYNEEEDEIYYNEELVGYADTD